MVGVGRKPSRVGIPKMLSPDNPVTRCNISAQEQNLCLWRVSVKAVSFYLTPTSMSFTLGPHIKLLLTDWAGDTHCVGTIDF